MMMQRARRLTQAVVAILLLYWLAIFASTHVPHLGRRGLDNMDKVFHFCAYFGLSVLVCLAWSVHRRLSWLHFAGVLGVLALYGAFDELSQIPVGRSCDIHDWYADVLGALTGIVAFQIVARLFRRRTAQLAVPRRARN